MEEPKVDLAAALGAAAPVGVRDEVWADIAPMPSRFHLHSERFNKAFIDIFRLTSGGMIVEHWHVAQEIPASSVSGHDMFSQLS